MNYLCSKVLTIYNNILNIYKNVFKEKRKVAWGRKLLMCGTHEPHQRMHTTTYSAEL